MELAKRCRNCSKGAARVVRVHAHPPPRARKFRSASQRPRRSLAQRGKQTSRSPRRILRCLRRFKPVSPSIDPTTWASGRTSSRPETSTTAAAVLISLARLRPSAERLWRKVAVSTGTCAIWTCSSHVFIVWIPRVRSAGPRCRRYAPEAPRLEKSGP